MLLFRDLTRRLGFAPDRFSQPFRKNPLILFSNPMRRAFPPAFIAVALLGFAASSSAADSAAVAEAGRIFAATGVKGGFVVHLGAGDAQLTAALRKNASFQVQGLERDATKVAAARERLLAE